MKVVKVVYNNKTAFILDILKRFEKIIIVEPYNVDITKEKKKALPIQTRYGSKNTPLLIFCNENLEEVDAIWVENNPNWNKDIKNKLKKLL
jgi:hypothetical protein